MAKKCKFKLSIDLAAHDVGLATEILLCGVVVDFGLCMKFV